MKPINTLALPLTLLLALTGCATQNSLARNGQDMKTLVVDRAITIPPGAARATFQGGSPVKKTHRLEASCTIESTSVSEQPQTIQPDRFTISNVSQYRTKDDLINLPNFRLIPSISCSEYLYYKTVLGLHSTAQPQIHKLTCTSVYRDCEPGHSPDADEIERVIGEGIYFE